MVKINIFRDGSVDLQVDGMLLSGVMLYMFKGKDLFRIELQIPESRHKTVDIVRALERNGIFFELKGDINGSFYVGDYDDNKICFVEV